MLGHLRGIKLAITALATLALAASAAPASAGTLYTNNYGDQQIAALSIGPDGLLTPLAGSPFPVPDYVGGLAITPDGQRMIAPFYFNDQLGVYSLASDGAPSQLGPLIPADITAYPAISPDGRFAYLGNGAGGGAGGGVRAYAIGADGSLTQVGDSFGGADGEGPALTPDGRFLLMPDYSEGAVERFAVQADGSLAPLGSTPLSGDGISYVHITPDGRFAVALRDFGPESSIQSLAIGTDGSLAPVGAPGEAVGAVSGVPVLSPNGLLYFNVNSNESSISVYAIAANGTLTAIGAPFPTDLDSPEGLAMSPDGRFLYAVENFAGDVQAFAVAADGTLTKLGGLVSTGGESDGAGPVTRPAVPVARLVASAAAPGAKSSFDASSSGDAGATLTTYTWNFGDGTTLSGPDPKPSHTYEKAGIYEVTLTVGDDAGCTGFVYTGQTAYCNAKGATTTVKLDTLPAISSLRAIRIRPGTATATASARSGKRRPPKPKRVAFEYTLSEEARANFTVERKVVGRKAGGKCERRTKGNAAKPKCVLRWRTVGSFSAAGRAGDNIARLPNRLGGSKPGPGAYRATAVATDPAGGISTPRTAGFKIKAPKRR
jgi:hypothetical protein